jgi:hypothetical protein
MGYFDFGTLNRLVSYFRVLADEARAKELLNPRLQFRGLEVLRLIEYTEVELLRQFELDFLQAGTNKDDNRSGLVLEFLEENRDNFGGRVPPVVIEEQCCMFIEESCGF